MIDEFDLRRFWLQLSGVCSLDFVDEPVTFGVKGTAVKIQGVPHQLNQGLDSIILIILNKVWKQIKDTSQMELAP